MTDKTRDYPIKLSVLMAAVVFCMLSAGISFGQEVPTLSRATRYLRYLDLERGMTADEVVAAAIANNTELDAMRKEAEAGEALLRQAGLRPNPSLTISGEKMIGGPDYGVMVEGGVPLELGGRRGARIRVAERELEIRNIAVAERERQLAAEVRTKFGQALAAILKLKFTEETVELASDNYELVSAQVDEGRRPPLEANMELVELNRMRAMVEIVDGQAEILLLELRNLAGMEPAEPLRLRGEFDSLIVLLPDQAAAVQQALDSRTDLAGARALELLAAARTEQARAEGRIDADVMAGYRRMRSGFPLSAFDPQGQLMPIDMRSHAFTFGVRLNLPVRNRNQGLIAASLLEEEAARQRREFGELTIRREVASAYADYNRAARAEQIFRTGVRDQAAQNLDVVRQTYELGSTTLLDYISELRRYIDIETGFIDAQRDAYLARIDVMRAINAPELIQR